MYPPQPPWPKTSGMNENIEVLDFSGWLLWKARVLGTLHIILQPYFTRNFLIMVRGMHFITTDHSSSLISSLHISFFLLLVPLVLTRFPRKLLCIVCIIESKGKLEENMSFMLSRKWGKWLCCLGKKFASKHLMTLVHYSICTQMHHRLLSL